MRILDQIDELSKSLPQMPFHTDNTVKIPRSYSQGLPKNLMDYSAEKMDDFINPNLAIIEEIAHRQPQSIIPKWFIEYQTKYYKNYNLLKGDGFFQTRLKDGYRRNLSPNLSEVRDVGMWGNLGQFLLAPHVNGATLESNSGGTTTDFSANLLMAFKMSSAGVIGEYYDQAALDIVSGSGNYRLGVYDTGATNLLGETGGVAVAAGYTFRAIPEFALTSTENWVSHLNDASPFNLDRSTTPASGRKYRSLSYTSMPNPWGTPDTTDSVVAQCKMGHS